MKCGKSYLNGVPAVHFCNCMVLQCTRRHAYLKKELRTEEIIHFSLCQQSGHNNNRIKR